jgi:hypothetical protein
MRIFKHDKPHKVVPEFIPLKTVDEMNAELTQQQKYSFMYLNVELELLGEEPCV